MQSTVLVSKQPGRIEALRARHELLSQKIEKEQKSYLREWYVKELKKQKLQIKQEIEGISKAS